MIMTLTRDYIETIRLIEVIMMARSMEDDAASGVRGDDFDFAMELWAQSVISTHAIYRDKGRAVASVPKQHFLLEGEEDRGGSRGGGGGGGGE